MKRDLDLYRDLLLFFENRIDPSDPNLLLDTDGFRGISDDDLPKSLKDEDPSVLIEHIELMHEAGLVRLSDPTRDITGATLLIRVQGITHDGHDFLANIRDDTVWKRTKEKAGDVALGIIKSVAEVVVKAQVGI